MRSGLLKAGTECSLAVRASISGVFIDVSGLSAEKESEYFCEVAESPLICWDLQPISVFGVPHVYRVFEPVQFNSEYPPEPVIRKGRCVLFMELVDADILVCLELWVTVEKVV